MLNDKQKERYKALAHSDYGAFLREELADLMVHLGDVSTVKSDPIESRKVALDIINNRLVSHLQQEKEKEHVDPDTYE